MKSGDGLKKRKSAKRASSTIALLLFTLVVLSSLPPSLALVSYKAFAQEQKISIKGAGASFPGPYYKSLAEEYHKLEPNVDIAYDTVGSGAGIKFFIAQSVDFGATDAPLDQTQREVAKGSIHLPLTIGSIVAAYNIPEIPDKGLKLTGIVLGDIFLGKITTWNDPEIKALNPGVNLPAHEIHVVHRSDGSGTTFVWTKYLSTVNPQWNSTVGYGTSVIWPIGLGGNGNGGVADSIVGNPYSIGYVELAYAITKQMHYASLMNRDGNFIEPSLASTQAAVASAAISLPAGDDSWTDVTLLNAPSKNSYSIASFSYILLYKDMSRVPTVDHEKAVALVKFLSWAVTDGQVLASRLSYVPLPANVVGHDLEILRSLTYGEESLAPAVPEFEAAVMVVLATSLAMYILFSIAELKRKTFFYRAS